MRISLLFGLMALLFGCHTGRGVPVEVSRDVRLGISFGETVSAVRNRRPQIEFAPYAGWIEEVGDTSSFRTVLYEFGKTPPGERPQNSGRLRAVRLTGRSVAETGIIITRLDMAHGPHRYYGCTPVPARGTPEEIAILRWGTAEYLVSAEILVSQNSHGKTYFREPIVVTIADRSTENEFSQRVNVQTSCFSRTYSF